MPTNTPPTNPNHWAKAILWQAEHSGIPIPFGGGTIRLAAAEKDRSLFSQGLIMLSTAESLLPDEAAREAFAQSPQTIADAAGVMHSMTVQQLRQLLVAYGMTYQSMWAAANAPVAAPEP